MTITFQQAIFKHESEGLVELATDLDYFAANPDSTTFGSTDQIRKQVLAWMLGGMAKRLAEIAAANGVDVKFHVDIDCIGKERVSCTSSAT